MTKHVFVISEWLPVCGRETLCWRLLKELMSTTKAQEDGCVSARATKQIQHPGSPGKSKYTIVLMQEYISVDAFDHHCNAKYVNDFIEKYIKNEDTAVISEGRCRLFSE